MTAKVKHRWEFDPRTWKVVAPVGLFVATIVLGSIGYKTGEGVWKAIGHLLGETSFEPGEKNLFVWISRATGVLLIYSAFFLLVHDQYRVCFNHWRVRRWCRRGKRHAVVCGLGWKGRVIVRGLIDEGVKVVGIDLDINAPEISELRAMGMAFFEGDATTVEHLRNAEVFDAEEIYIVAGSDEVNCRIAMQIQQAWPTRAEAGRVIAYACVSDHQSRIYLENASRAASLRFHCFDPLELATRELFREKGCVASDPTIPNVHSVVFGHGAAAWAVLKQSLAMLHLRTGAAAEITVVCEGAATARARALKECPCLCDAADLSDEMARVADGLFPKVEFVELPTANADLLAADFAVYKHLAAPDWRVNVYFCLDDGVRSLGLMEVLSRRMLWARPIKERGSRDDLMIAAYFNYPERTGDLPETPFCEEYGSFGESCTPAFIRSTKSEALARELMRFFMFKYGGEDRENRQKDGPLAFQRFLLHSWLDAEEWERDSNRQAADHLYVKLALHGCRNGSGNIQRFIEALNDPSTLEEMAELEHRRWCAERLLLGWLPLSNNDDMEKWFSDPDFRKQMKHLRHHADLVPYSALRAEEKGKDHEMIKVLPGLLEKMG